MLRIITTLTCVLVLNQALIAQDTTFAKARQLYHKEYMASPNTESPNIFELLDIIGKEHVFTAVCPTNGGEPLLIRNEGKALHLGPSSTPLHDWEPHSWQYFEEQSAWKALCPGDSVYFEYFIEDDNRANCSPELDLPEWPTINSLNPWWLETTENNMQSNGSAYTYLGADGIFDKPLILVEGFDFAPGANLEEHRHGGFGWTDIWGCNLYNYPGTQYYPIMLDSLHNEGYDIVFVDFEHGTSTIERKSILVKHVIRLCNEYKESNHSNVIIGASMGGVVVRHGLKTMENAGEQHCCRIFTSIDSPHKGANISPGLQAIVHLLGPQSSEAAIFSTGLNSPAAKQLLQFSYQGNEDYENAQEMLDNLGFPKNTTNLSIANANPNVEIELDQAPLLNWSNYYFPIGTAHLIANRTYSGAEGWQQAASCALPDDFVPFNNTPLWYEYEMYYYNDGIDRDIQPSSLGRHMGLLVNAINSAGDICIHEDQYQEACGFISYNSALAIDENGNIPFDRWHGAAEWEAPQEHVELSYMHRKLILDNIILGDKMAPAELNAETIAEFYSYNSSDLPHRWIGNTTVSNGGILSIETIVKTRPCSSIIDILNNGELRIGSPSTNNPGELILKGGSILNSIGENDFSINPGSKLIVEDEAVLTLDGTTLNVDTDASLIIEEGGLIILKNGAHINLNDNTSALKCSGEILVLGDAHSVIESQASVACNIELNLGSKIYTSPNSSLSILGNDVLQLSVNENYAFAIEGYGSVEVSNSTIFIPCTSSIYNDTKLSFEGTSIYGESGALLKSSNKISLDECIWSNVNLLLNGAGSKSLKSMNSEYDNSNFTLYDSGVTLEDNHFNATTLKIQESIGHSTVKNNTFVGGEELNESVLYIKNCSEMLFLENQFSLGYNAMNIHESPVTLKCNHFDTWNTALIISGNSYVKMNTALGGHNHFNNNRLHIGFESAELPLLNNGNNTFGAHSINCFAGSISTPTTLWNIEGNSWLASSLSNGSNGGVLASDMWCNSTSLPVAVIVDAPSNASYSCPDSENPTVMIDGKNLSVQGVYDVLGRENRLNNSIISKPSGTGQGQLNILQDPSLK